MKEICRICGHNNQSEAFYPDILFNSKYFKYYKCNNCKSFNVYPTPNQEDFDLMYGENDHEYLKEIEGKLNYNFNYPYGDHQGFQIKFLKQIASKLENKSLLDYGCGSGFYMKFAEKLGAHTIGIEFDSKFVKLLKEKTDLDLYTFNIFKENFKDRKFDFIHIGHVFEHLDQPKDLLQELFKYAHKDTVFLIDGPLERNSCIARWYIDLGSKIKARKFKAFPPQHISFSTAKSQLLFFDNSGLEKEAYFVKEQFYPLPNHFTKSTIGNISHIIGHISILFSKLSPDLGNVFHYRGKLKNSSRNE